MNIKQNKILFEEKQFLGLNQYSIYRRVIFLLFCITLYFLPNKNGLVDVKNTLLLISLLIVFFSILLLCILHLHTKVYKDFIEIDGFWTTRIVKIPISKIVKAKIIKYKRNIFNRPLYNLHINGKIKFYTRGNYVVQLTDINDMKYIIGTQQPDKLLKIIKKQILL